MSNFFPTADATSLGVVERLENGDAVVRPEGSKEPRWFVPRRRLAGVLDGDRVRVEPTGERRRSWSGGLEEATIVEVVEATATRLVGSLSLDGLGRPWLIPFDSKNDLEIELHGGDGLNGGDGLADGTFVVADLDRDSAHRRTLQARVVEVLGKVDELGVDSKVIARYYELPDELPAAVEAESRRLPADPSPADWAGREDLRAAVVVTIDGEKARDFDDAISVERRADGSFLLGVHIADVAHYVRPGTALDTEAYRRGTSVYFPDRVLPMLPEGLSNGLCSLRPNVPRLTLSAFLEISPDGEIVGRRFAETVIESRRRLTYEEVRRLLDEPHPDDASHYGAVRVMLGNAAALTHVLGRRRESRGSLDFDLPSGDLVLDAEGQLIEILAGQRSIAHRLIESLMIAANEAVAFELQGAEVPALYRVHDRPTPLALDELRTALATLGEQLPAGLAVVSPKAFADLLAAVAGRPDEAVISSLVLRSLARAIYTPENRGHFALASDHYCHFTSPIRRYPDLVVHRQLKAHLRGSRGATDLAERLPEMAEHLSTTERRAEQAERELLQWKKVRFLADRVGERFHGRITGVIPFGFFVQLDEILVDGLVPIRELADDFYVYETEGRRLAGSNLGRTFQLGQAIEVILAGVSERHRGLNLRPAELWSKPKSKGGGQHGSRVSPAPKPKGKKPYRRGRR